MLTGSLSRDLESPYRLGHFEAATWGGYNVFDGCAIDANVIALRLHRTMSKLNTTLIIFMYKHCFSPNQIAGFASDQPGVWGMKLSTRLSWKTIYTRRASLVPSRLFNMLITGDDKI